MNLRTITCDIPGCRQRYEETAPGDGFPGWGQLHGISLNEISNPLLCPGHLAKLAAYTDSLKEEGT